MSKPSAIAIPFLGPMTAALLAADPGPAVALGAVYTYVDEFDATYRWVPGSAVAADGFRVIGHTGGAAGRWILDGTAITLYATGLAATQWARAASAWTAMAGFGKVILAGAWACETNEITPIGAYIEFAPGATVVMDLAVSPGFAGSPFFSDSGGPATALTDISVASVAGDISQTLTSVVGFAIGTRVTVRMIVGELYRYSRRIINIVGNVVTYDRPLKRAFPIGTEVIAVPGIRDVTIIGNGVVFTGTGDAIVQLIAAWDCYVENVVDDTTALTICPFNYDVASRDCKFSRCRADGKGVTPANFLIDSGENCVIEDCDGRGALNIAIQFSSSEDLRVIRGTFSDGVGTGLLLSVLAAPGAASLGTRGTYVEGTAFLRFNNGVVVENGSSFNTLSGIDSSYNTVAGVAFSTSAAPVNSNHVVGGVVQGNGQTGISAASGVNDAVGVSFVDNVGSASLISAGGVLHVIGGVVTDTSTAALLGVGIFHATGAGSRMVLDGVQGSSTRAIHHFAVLELAGHADICGGARFDSGAANQAGLLMNGPSTANVDDFTVVSAGGFGVFLNDAAAFCRLGDHVDVAACGTPYLAGAGAFNRSLVPVALNGAVPVPLAFGDTNAQDRCFVTWVAAAGVPTGQIFVGAPVVGTGFNVVGVAGDTSTFNYEIR